jgi:hypothetical protein
MSVWRSAKSCTGTGSSCLYTSLFVLNINPGNLCIGSTGNFIFGSFTAASVVQSTSWSFVGTWWYFYVDDMRGSSSGYYTTVQLSTWLVSNGGSSIARSNVFMKTASVGTLGVTLLDGMINNTVVIHSGMISYQTLDIPRQLIGRVAWFNNGSVGKYGVLPQMQINVPAYQAVGTYTGTLLYTLYQN